MCNFFSKTSLKPVVISVFEIKDFQYGADGRKIEDFQNGIQFSTKWRSVPVKYIAIIYLNMRLSEN